MCKAVLKTGDAAVTLNKLVPNLITLSSPVEPGNEQANTRPNGDTVNTATVSLYSLMSASFSLGIRKFFSQTSNLA